MRACAKMRCDEPAVAAVGVRYDERVVVVGELPANLDPNLIELCEVHTLRLTPPLGWGTLDSRPGPTSATLARDLTA